jgi:hypothetical protein
MASWPPPPCPSCVSFLCPHLKPHIHTLARSSNCHLSLCCSGSKEAWREGKCVFIQERLTAGSAGHKVDGWSLTWGKGVALPILPLIWVAWERHARLFCRVLQCEATHTQPCEPDTQR